MGRYSRPKCVVSERELNMMSARRSGSKYVVEKMNLITVHLLEYQEVKILGQTGKVPGPVLYGHWTGKVLGQSVHLGNSLQIHFRDPPSMFETMAVQNLRKPTDWLFKVKYWHGVILNLAQNGLRPVATNNF